MATANKVLNIIEAENVVAHARDAGAYFLAQLRAALADHPMVGEVRGLGLLAGVEFVADPPKRRAFDPSLKVGARVSNACRARNLIARAMPQGDILVFSPALTISHADIDEMVAITQAAVHEVYAELRTERAL